MQLIEYRHIKNKKAKRLNLLKGSKPRNPSQTNGAANIQINLDTAIPNLRNVAQKYIGIVNPYGFLTDLRKALGIPNSSGVSKYGKVTIPKDDGSVLQASLRVTNHQANADKYVEHNTNYEYNLSIVVRRKQRKNTFIPNDNVKLDEFVYYGNNLAKVENPLTQIVNSIIGFLQNGTYKDTTGVAFLNQSPQQQEDSNNNQTNENKTMKQKQTIRLNESQLNRIIKESVYSVIREGVDDDIDSSLQQCWELLMTAYNQAVDKTVSEYGWGDSKLPEKYEFTMKILGEINKLIYAFDRAYRADYYQQKWDRETHEQD